MKNNIATNIFITFMVMTIFIGWDVARTPVTEVEAHEPVNPTTILKQPEIISVVSTITPTPTHTSKVIKRSEKPQSTEEMIKETFGKDARVALAVAKCESGLRHEAMNDNTKWGGVGRDWSIFQINDWYHRDKANISELTAEQNIKLAKKIFDGSGWRAWSCFKNGKYRKHL